MKKKHFYYKVCSRFMIQILKQDKETADHILETPRSGLFGSNHKSADTDEARSIDTSQWIDYRN